MTSVSQSPASVHLAANAAAPAPLERAVALGNSLLATYNLADGPAPDARHATNARRQKLQQLGLTPQGPRAGAKPPPAAPPATAAVLALLDSDDGVRKLRVWASLVAAARWAAAQAQDPLDDGALLGTALLERSRGARAVHLRLPGTRTPLVVPLINLVRDDWAQLTPGDRREPLHAALDVRELWHLLPPHPGNAEAFAWLASTLVHLRRQASLSPARAAMLDAAAAQLTEVAAAGGVVRRPPQATSPAEPAMPVAGAKQLPTDAAPPSYADATAPQRPGTPAPTPGPTLGKYTPVPSYADVIAPSVPPAPARPPAARPVAPPAPALVVSASSAVHRSANTNAHAPSPAGAQTSRVPAVGRDGQSAGPVSAQGLQRALAALTSQQRDAAAAARTGAGGGQVTSAAASTPTPASDATSLGSDEHWSDAREALVGSGATTAPAATESGACSPGDHAAPPGAASPQAPSAPSPAALWTLTAAAAADAWRVLDRTPTTAANLLARPPEGPLPPALVPTVLGWLRRLSAHPAEAVPFLRHHGEALTSWQREPALLAEIGRLLVHWPRAEASPRPVQCWLAAAAAHDDGAAWLQVLRQCAPGSPLYDEALLALLAQACELPPDTVVAFVRLTGEKLARKRGVEAEVRRDYEQTLAQILGVVPRASAGLDLTQPCAWRVLAACRLAPRALALEAAVAATTQSNADENAAAALLADAGRSAPVDLQLELASKLLVKRPWDVALGREIAAALTRNKKALTGDNPKLQASMVARSVRNLLAVCAEADQAWARPASEVAVAVWQGLEQVQFVVPALLARGAALEAASVVHGAHGHARLFAHSLARLACELPEDQAEQLAQGLDDTSGNRIIHVQATCSALHRRLRTRSRQAERDADRQAIGRLQAELNRSLEANKAWKATAATHLLIGWSAADATDGALFGPDAQPSPRLEQLLTRVARRQAHAPWHPAERPMRKLRRLLAASAADRARLVAYLHAGIARQQDGWATMSLSQPVVEALLDATPVPRERRQLAEQFEKASGLWPVVAGDDGVSYHGLVREDQLPARAELAPALLPALLADNPTAAPVHPLEVNRRRAKLHAAIVHVLREPDHRTWRLPALLRQAAASGALSPEHLAVTARAGVCAVTQEYFAKQNRTKTYETIGSGFEAALSVGQQPVLGTTLAEAVLDGVADAIDACATPTEAYSIVHPVFDAATRSLAKRADRASDAALVKTLHRRLWTRTLQAKVTVDHRVGQQMSLGSDLLDECGAVGAHLALQAWLTAPEREAIARGYAAVVTAWCDGAQARNLEDKPVTLALEATALACVDLELRAHVLAAMAAHGAPVPALNTALLLAMAKRRPLTPFDRAALARIAGGPTVSAALDGR